MLAAALVGAYPLSLGENAGRGARSSAGAPRRARLTRCCSTSASARVRSRPGRRGVAAAGRLSDALPQPAGLPDIPASPPAPAWAPCSGISWRCPWQPSSCWLCRRARHRRNSSTHAALVRSAIRFLVLVLAGVVVGSLAGAAISLLRRFSSDPTTSSRRSCSGCSLPLRHPQGRSVVAAPLVALGRCRWCAALAHQCAVAGRPRGQGAGRGGGALRSSWWAAANALTASVVAISGVIGWSPRHPAHARHGGRASFDRLLPTAMLLGASYLLLVDTLARTWRASEVPIGILTAIIRRAVLPYGCCAGAGGLVMIPPCWRRTARLRLWRQDRRPRRELGLQPARCLPARTQRLGQDHAVKTTAPPAA